MLATLSETFPTAFARLHAQRAAAVAAGKPTTDIDAQIAKKTTERNNKQVELANLPRPPTQSDF